MENNIHSTQESKRTSATASVDTVDKRSLKCNSCVASALCAPFGFDPKAVYYHYLYRSKCIRCTAAICDEVKICDVVIRCMAERNER